MQTLIVDCGGFVLEHSVYLVTQEGISRTAAQLPTAEIAGYAFAAGVDKIYLRGPKEYCFGIQEEISKQLKTEYSNENIEIEVI